MNTTWARVATTLPEAATPEREALLLEQVRAGNIQHNWATITAESGGHRIELDVSEDALRVGAPQDAVRITVNASTAQRIADQLDGMLLTPRMADLIRQQADIVVEPAVQAANATMGTTSRMVAHSRAVDQRVAGRAGLVANAGKDWVLTNELSGRPDRAANYGWFVERSSYRATLPGLDVLQPLGLAHNRFHVDYSQTVRLVRKVCRIDGVERATADVLSDAALARLVCHEGVLRVLRMPAVALGSTEVPPPPRDPIEAVPRVLRRGMAGSDVAAWQRSIGAEPVDGIFGAITEAATRRWQGLHGLVTDGIVGPKSRAVAGGPRVFIQAKNYGKGRTAQIDTIVIHTMEAAEKPDTAERVAQWLASPGAPMASAHYCIDADSVVQCVLDGDTAFHAPGVNQRAIGVEHAGFARQTPEDWADPYSQTMMRRSAALVASLCARHQVPIRFVDVDALKAGEPGITTHNAVSLAFRRSSHTDPGPGFPIHRYLAMVREYFVMPEQFVA
jgi:peptidoglycan hydrolase-like protein with peptidoglycan-binding domain/N-acetyl-anhydromuramyl-L-alanine amidase AmpD